METMGSALRPRGTASHRLAVVVILLLALGVGLAGLNAIGFINLNVDGIVSAQPAQPAQVQHGGTANDVRAGVIGGTRAGRGGEGGTRAPSTGTGSNQTNKLAEPESDG
jgi:hypothetical protein